MGFNTVMTGLKAAVTQQSEEDKAKAAKKAEDDRLAAAVATAQSNYQNATTGQNALAQALQAQMAGQGPNLAQQQLQQATNRNIGQGAGLISSQKGISPALAARLIANQTAGVQQEAAGQSGILRSQQQLAAQGQLGNVYGAEGQLANANLGTNLGYMSSKYSTDTHAAENAANVASERAKNDRQANETGINTFLGAGQGIMSLLSDERAKKDITDGNRSSYEFLEKIGAHKYKYKNPEIGGEGEFVSPMAQELEKTPQGKNLVSDTPEGKVVDMGHAAGLLMANQAALHDRLKKLEKPQYDEGGNVFADFGKGFAKMDASIKSSQGEDPSEKRRKLTKDFTESLGNLKSKDPIDETIVDDYVGPDIGAGTEIPSFVAAEGGKVPKLGTGKRFENLENKLSNQEGVRDPAALAAAIGRKKFGANKFAALAHHAHGGKVDALVSPGEIYLTPQQVAKVHSGADPRKIGEKIPGHAPVKGNDPRNDIVRKKLEVGGAVVPRTHAEDSEKAAEFVKALKREKGEPKGYSRVLNAKRKMK